MVSYKGRIYDIKDGTDARQIYIRLSDQYYIKAEVTVDEFYVTPSNLTILLDSLRLSKYFSNFAVNNIFC